MTTKGNLTREQAIDIVGIEVVDEVDNERCEPTGRHGFNGSIQGDALIEWSTSALGVGSTVGLGVDSRGRPCTVIAYYYTDRVDEGDAEDSGWDNIYFDWATPTGYEVI